MLDGLTDVLSTIRSRDPQALYRIGGHYVATCNHHSCDMSSLVFTRIFIFAVFRAVAYITLDKI